MHQNQFFRGDPFVQQRVMNNEQKNTTPDLEHNLIVFEICNNWDDVKDLYKRIEQGNVDLVNQMEGLWIQFLSKNQIDLNKFNDIDEFEQKFLK